MSVVSSPDLRMMSMACWNSECAMCASLSRMCACSNVTAMAVLSFALLQLVTRPPSTVRHSWAGREGGRQEREGGEVKERKQWYSPPD